MASSVADLVRVQPPQPPASILPPKAVVAPTRKFDDVLSEQRAQTAKPEAPKVDADKPDPAKAAVAKPAQTTDKTDTEAGPDETPDGDHHSDEKIDAAKAADASRTDAPAKPAKATGKTAQKLKGIVDPDDDDDESVDTTDDADPAAQAAVNAVKGPTQQSPGDGHPPKGADAEDAPPVKKKSQPTAAAVPAAVATAANAAVTPTPNDLAKTAAKPGPETATDPTAAMSAVATTRAQPKQAPGLTQGTEAEDATGAAKVAVKSQKGAKAPAAIDTDADATTAIQLPPDATVDADQTAPETDADAETAALQAIAGEKTPTPTPVLPPVQPAHAAADPQRTVAENNVDHIVTSVRGELLTKGGAMQIRLDPPTLGTVHVQIDVAENGSLSASIQTTNEQATRMLSHSLAQLKTSLESVGVTVDHIQVKQAAPSEQSSNSQTGDQTDRGNQHNAGEDQSAKQEQQRREMLQRMWAKLAGDPLDLVA